MGVAATKKKVCHSLRRGRPNLKNILDVLTVDENECVEILGAYASVKGLCKGGSFVMHSVHVCNAGTP